MRLRKNRLLRWLACCLSLLSVGSLSSPVPVSAAGVGVTDGYRSVDGLEFSSLDDLLVSEAHNRVIIVGDDRLEFLALDSLDPVVTVDRAAGILDSSVQGGSVFFASSDGVITELALADGSATNEWSTAAVNVTSIAVEDDWVWYTFGVNSNDAGVARISRRAQGSQLIEISERIHERSLVRLSQARPGQFFLANRASSSGQISRYRLDGLSAVLEASAYRGKAVRSLEVSAEGGRAWTAEGSVTELDGETLAMSAVSYQSSPLTDMAMEATQGQLVASTHELEGGGREVRVFESGVPVARSVIPLYYYESKVALTTDEVLVVTKRFDDIMLQIWSIDYVPQAHSVEISLASHGINYNGAPMVTVTCSDGFSQVSRPEFGSTIIVELPPDADDCSILRLRNSGRTISTFRWPSGDIDLAELDPTDAGRSALSFDSRDGESFLFVSHFDWPLDNPDMLIRQMYLDLFDRVLYPSEFNEIEYEARLAGLRNDTTGFVLNVMDNPGAYERTHAPIARLYSAFFLRDPDVGGQSYWVGLANGGLSLALTAEYFEVSEEFALRYGELDDREFVALVYENVMGREPDQGGYDYWLEQMERGMSRGELMIYFSDSPEYRNKVSGRVFVVYASRILEQRDPSEADIDQLLAAYRSGGREAVVAAILDGDAYYRRFWSNGASPIALP